MGKAFSWGHIFQQMQERKRENKEREKQAEMEFLVIHLRDCHFNSPPTPPPHPLSLSLSLPLSLFSSYCSRRGDFSFFSSSDTIKECTVISPAQLQQNKELQ